MLEALHREMEVRKDFIGGQTVETLYIGGGTPTVCSVEEIGRLIERVKQVWHVSSFKELTLEANPEDLTEDYLCELSKTQVNRLSIGIQSFVGRDLTWMNRRHTADTARRSVETAKKYGFGNISIDLIYGIPAMTGPEWEYNLDEALRLDVPHLSAYHLTFEEKTVFGKKLRKGLITPVGEAVSEQQYRLLEDRMKKSGYDHYEVSNFARPGFEAMHNSGYWHRVPYIGIGPSAHSYSGRVRQWNVSNNNMYLEKLGSGTFFEQETLTDNQLYNEYIMTGLRTAKGIRLSEVSSAFGAGRREYLLNESRRFLDNGTLVLENDRLFIPTSEFLLSDAVIAGLFI